jgi:hypothetical protein
MKKICSKCKRKKDEKEFYKDNRAKDGLQSACKECSKKWQKDNPEYMKEYRKANAEKERERSRKWQKAHPENHRERQHKYYKAHAEEINEQERKRQQAIRAGWLLWMIDNGHPMPSKPDVAYHHPEDNKLFSIGWFLYTHKRTPENEELLETELNKCIVMNNIEHLQEHRDRGDVK